MVSFNQVVRGVLVRGVLPSKEENVASFSQMMVSGKLNNLVPGEFGIVVGGNWRNP